MENQIVELTAAETEQVEGGIMWMGFFVYCMSGGTVVIPAYE